MASSELSHLAPIGRKDEFDRARGWLANDARLVSLVGMGGVGKTVLSMALEAEWRAASPSRASLSVVLDGVTSHAQCARALAACFGDAAETAERIANELAARGDVLVRIESTEGVLESMRALVRAVRDRAPRARLLMTSRVRMGLEQEQVLPIHAFSIERLEASRRIFVDATRAQFGIDLDLSEPATARAVDAIVLAVEGHPLAIRLAASRAGFIGLAAVAAEAPSRPSFFDGVGADGGSALDRCLDSTYDALSDQGRTGLELAGCFRGGFTLEAWKEAFGTDSAAMLDELGRHSLLHLGGEARGEARGEGRLDVPSPVRAHALRRRPTGKGRREHLAYFRKRARTEALALEGPEHRRAFLWLSAERSNLLAALETAQESAPEEAGWLLLALLYVDRLRGGEHLHHEAAASFLDAGLARDPDLRVLLLASVAILDIKTLSPRAEARCTETLGAADQAHPLAAGLALQRIGLAFGGSGHIERALETLDAAEAAFARTSYAHGAAQVAFARAIVWRERGESQRATREHQRAVGIQTVLQVAIDDYPYWALLRGFDALDRELAPDAARFLDAALRGATRDGIPWLEAHATIALGLARALSGAWEQAADAFSAGETLARRLENGWVGAHAAAYGCLVAFARDAQAPHDRAPFATAALALRAFGLEPRAMVLERIESRWREEGEVDAARLAAEIVDALKLDATELRMIAAAVRAHAETRDGSVILLDPAGVGFRGTDKAWVDLGKRPVARSLLRALVQAHLRSAGLSPLEVREALWPDERMLESAAKERVHATVKIVRDLGLRSVLTWRDGVYRLEGAFRIAPPR